MEAGARNHPTFDAYWRSRVAQWSKVEVPTYAVTEWSNNLHLRGTLEAWKQIGSKHKYLDINGGKEWAEFYSDWGFRRQRAFLGEYLKGEDNGVANWSAVRIALRQNGQNWQFREESAWPLARAKYRAYYLDATNRTLISAHPSPESSIQYSSTGEDQCATFDLRFDVRTEVTGNSKLRIWLAADFSNDADVFVAFEKLDRTLRLIIKGSEVHRVPGAAFAIRHAPLNNDGNHIVHTGGRYDSHLLLPIIEN